MGNVRRRWWVAALLGLVVLAASACARQAPQAGQAPPFQAQEPAKVTFAIDQEPDNLNPLLAVMVYSRVIRQVAVEGLVKAGPDGAFYPVLAAEVPTAENGGVSPDGLTVTYRLKQGVVWSDGTPFTSRDVKFTWQAIMDERNEVPSRAGYDKIESLDTPDDYTVILRFRELYTPYLSLFTELLPAHRFSDTSINVVEYNRAPLGTGPFTIKEWQSGNYVLAEKNPKYRDADRVQIDQIIFKFVPSREVGVAQLKAGQVDIVNIPENLAKQVEGAAGVRLVWSPSSGIEYLGLNLADPADLGKPHPILGDVNVRKAIALAIDKQSMVERLLYGYGQVAHAPIPMGWAADPSIQAPGYDPEAAKKLLDEAGWRDGDGDGIREKGGRKLSLRIMAPAGTQIRELTEQIIAENLKAVGIELTIDNRPASVMFGSWADQGPLKRGQYDIAEDYWGPDLDPGEFMFMLFHSSQIPTAANNGAGWNFIRIPDKNLDAHIEQAAATLNLGQRKLHYSLATRALLETYAYIPLYQRADIFGVGERLEGVKVNPWDANMVTWSVVDWRVPR